jgi:hypothetical protein
LTGGVKNINPLSKNSFRKFLHKRKAVLIGLIVMGFGVFLVGQTVPQNFFKKIFSPQKVSVAKDSAGSKQNRPRIRVVKKPVVVEAEKKLALTINCPGNQTFCSTNGIDYTYTGTVLDPTTNCAGGFTSSTYTSSGAGVNPNIGSGIATLNNAIFNVGPTTVTWVSTDACGTTTTCVVTVTVNLSPNNASGGFTGNTICTGSNGQLTFDAIDASFVTPYTIQYTDGVTTWTQIISSATATTFNVAVNPSATTTYTLTSITNGNGCVQSSGFGDATAQIVVHQLPNNITTGGFTGNSFCVSGVGPGTLTFDADNTNFTSGSIQYSDGTTTYTQVIPNNAAFTFNAADNPTTAGNHDYTIVSITNEFGCTTTSGFNDPTARITINQLPTTPTAGTDKTIVIVGSFTLAGNKPNYW